MVRDPAFRDTKDQPVHLAAGADADELARLLDGNPALRDARGWFGRFPLHLAAEKGNARAVQVLLERGADANAEEGLFGQTPLHHAMGGDSIECVHLLLAAGADPNALDTREETPIFYACSRQVLQRLVESGAQLEVVSNRGQRPFQYCAAYIGSLEVLRFWLECGVPVNEVPRFGWPALLAPCGGGLPERRVNEAGRIALMALLLEHGAEINLQDLTGATALSYAAGSHLHLIECVRFLLERGADPNRPTRSGDTPLHLAVGRDYTDIVELLLHHGADPNLENIGRYVPLDMCVTDGAIRGILTPITQRVNHPLPTAEAVLARLQAIPKYAEVKFKGSTAKEVSHLERHLGVKLPKAYRRFLRTLGRGAGDFMLSDHWRFQIEEVPALAQDEYADCCDLPPHAFVFAERNGAYWVFFVADGQSDDPPVFAFDDGTDRTYQQLARSVWEFVEQLVIYYEFHFGPPSR